MYCAYVPKNMVIVHRRIGAVIVHRRIIVVIVHRSLGLFGPALCLT